MFDITVNDGKKARLVQYSYHLADDGARIAFFLGRMTEEEARAILCLAAPAVARRWGLARSETNWIVNLGGDVFIIVFRPQPKTSTSERDAIEKVILRKSF